MKLAIRVSPNARKSECLGWEDHPTAGRVLRLRIAAPPLEGKANKEVIRFVADLLGVSRSAISFHHGESGRIKMLDIPDACADALNHLS
jgi:uncharacterized protein (TIGR00251 family)